MNSTRISPRMDVGSRTYRTSLDALKCTVQPYPGPGARQQISVDGGTAPAWSRDGRELFYMTAPSVGGQAALTKMMVVPVQLKPTFTAGTPRMLFEGRYGVTANIRGYDVAPDGRRFLMVQQKDRPATRVADMIIVQNWIEELKQRECARSKRAGTERGADDLDE